LIQGPSASDAGKYRCNIKNDQGETNANLALNFEQEPPEKREKSEHGSEELRGERSPSRSRKEAGSRPSSRGPGSRPGSPKKQLKSREGTPKKSTKEREGTPTKRASTPRKDLDEKTGEPGEKQLSNIATRDCSEA
jgi:hypothetical protein